jgi:hypothetical protein
MRFMDAPLAKPTHTNTANAARSSYSLEIEFGSRLLKHFSRGVIISALTALHAN